MSTASSSLQVLHFTEEDLDAPLIPEAEYRARLLDHATVTQFGSPKMILTFQLTEFGPHHGLKLSAYYNVERIIGKPGKKGKAKHKRTGNFLVEYFTALPGQPRPRRLDRIAMEPLYNAVIVCQVVTVKQNSKRERLPEQLWYSKIGRMIRTEN